MGSFQQMTSQGRSCSGVSSPAGRSTSTGAVDVAAALISCILSGFRGPGERDLDSERGSCYKVTPSHEGGARVSIPVRPLAAGGSRTASSAGRRNAFLHRAVVHQLAIVSVR